MERYKLISPIFSSNSRKLTINSEAVVINAGSVLWIPIITVKPKSILRWSFHIKDYNCGFGISTSKDDMINDCIVEREVFEANKEVTGSVVIENPTTVYLFWDNSYSWIRSKTVLYSISIEQPTDILTDKHIASATFFDDIRETKEKIAQLEQTLNQRERELEDINSMIKHTKETYNIAINDDRIIKQKIDTCIQKRDHLMQTKQDCLTEIQQLTVLAPFLLETERITSLLAPSDLVNLLAVHSSLHRILHMSQVWRSVPSLPPELEVIPWVAAISRRLNKEPIPSVLELNNQPGETYTKAALADQINEKQLLRWEDLILLYTVTEKEGWYMTVDFFCYYVRVDDWEKKAFTVIYPQLTLELLMNYLSRVSASSRILPLPGTVNGETGFYINRSRRVTRWEVREGVREGVSFDCRC